RNTLKNLHCMVGNDLDVVEVACRPRKMVTDRNDESAKTMEFLGERRGQCYAAWGWATRICDGSTITPLRASSSAANGRGVLVNGILDRSNHSQNRCGARFRPRKGSKPFSVLIARCPTMSRPS